MDVFSDPCSLFHRSVGPTALAICPDGQFIVLSVLHAGGCGDSSRLLLGFGEPLEDFDPIYASSAAPTAKRPSSSYGHMVGVSAQKAVTIFVYLATAVNFITTSKSIYIYIRS